ncbi:MAG: DUF2089 domain-containing protein [Thermacetogeniaceae bacterium]
MGRPMLGRCPICGSRMDVTRLHCDSCDSTLEGRFDTCRFCQLSQEQQVFVEVFLKSRGNIKEVERELGISYPTVRSRLDSVLEALGYQSEMSVEDFSQHRNDVLEALDRGELTADEAAKLLKQI